MLNLACLTGIGRIVLLYWAAWLSIVVTTNLLNVFVAVGALPQKRSPRVYANPALRLELRLPGERWSVSSNETAASTLPP